MPGRAGVDEDFEGFGWGRFERLRLESDGGTIELAGVVLLALHTSEEEASTPGDLDLELRVGEEVLIISLTRFLAAWALHLPSAATWVLALCNPRHQRIARPPSVPTGVALWYALGDVDAWSELGETGPEIWGLTAKRWICI